MLVQASANRRLTTLRIVTLVLRFSKTRTFSRAAFGKCELGIFLVVAPIRRAYPQPVFLEVRR